MRKHGQGNIEEHPKGSGRHRVRAFVDGKLRTVASGLSFVEAQEIAAAYTTTRNELTLKEGITWGDFGQEFFDRREKRGYRAVDKERSVWRTRIAKDRIASLCIRTTMRRDAVELLDRLLGKCATVQSARIAFNMMRVVAREACDRGLLEHNPFSDVKIPRQIDHTHEEDLAGVLAPAEQQALIAAIPNPREREFAVFALCSGLRFSELVWLKKEDIRDGAVLVSRSRKGRPTKSGKPRRVPLLPPAAQAAFYAEQAWPGSPWLWPAIQGGRRDEKRPLEWLSWVKAAGIKRRIRFHDLRHTCATSLLAGWWGRRWTLDEVCKMLGHSSVTVTERYAKKLDETLELAVAGTSFGTFPSGKLEDPKPPKLLEGRTVLKTEGDASAPRASKTGKIAGFAIDASRDWESFGKEPEQHDLSVAIAEHRARVDADELLSRPLAKVPPELQRGRKTGSGGHGE